MMKRLMVAMLAVAAMTSCSKESTEEDIIPDTPVKVQFNAGVMDVQAKALVTGTTLPDGNMGVYAWDGGTTDFSKTTHENLNNAKIAVSTNGTKFDFEAGHEAFWPVGTLDFYAYYPQVTGADLIAATASTTPKVNIKLTDQIDYMWASPVKEAKKATPTVNFTFKHALSAITIIVKKEADAGTVNLSAIKIAKYHATSQMDIATGDLTADASEVEFPISITAADLSEAGDEFVTDYLVWPGSAPEFTLTLNNIDKTVTPKDGENELIFTTNKKHTLTFTITATGIQVTASATDWSAGNNGTGSI